MNDASSKTTDESSSKTTKRDSSLEHDDPYSAYYLNHTDNSNSGAVTTLLDGRNYHTWHRDFEINLKLKNKMGFVDGTLAMPTSDDPNLQAWVKCNTLVTCTCREVHSK
ncbi:unnamed protein product [Cuscuta epithymum]|uniref:Retrotransposon Copia-like N-terminal domain-containing protein n=1 Tax=Cuscuta epithymum TaxID=186058 RepID=A0AAV0DRD7_9ASTE|nr:unnamed protein product [Cuscuta epithymum]